MDKPNNPYRTKTIIYRVMDKDWSKITKKEIAKKLRTSRKYVEHCMYRIYDDTGYQVPHIDGRTKLKFQNNPRDARGRFVKRI